MLDASLLQRLARMLLGSPRSPGSVLGSLRHPSICRPEKQGQKCSTNTKTNPRPRPLSSAKGGVPDRTYPSPSPKLLGSHHHQHLHPPGTYWPGYSPASQRISLRPATTYLCHIGRKDRLRLRQNGHRHKVYPVGCRHGIIPGESLYREDSADGPLVVSSLPRVHPTPSDRVDKQYEPRYDST
jgi:hypothetical protein